MDNGGILIQQYSIYGTVPWHGIIVGIFRVVKDRRVLSHPIFYLSIGVIKE